MIENGYPNGSYVLSYGGRRIAFRLEYRKRKKLAITVHPDLRLQVVAPEGRAKEPILQRVEKRAPWILRQWRYFEQFQPTCLAPRFVSGETHLYLGRQYRLKVHQDAAEAVKLIGTFLHVWTSNGEDGERTKALLDYWYREHAKRVLGRRLQVCLDQRPSLKLAHEPRVTIRRMTHRWGSCTKAGNVLLNLNLIKVPVHCVDYVITHELCHLFVHNHTPAFYRLLGRSMPDWERRKARLDEFVV